MLNISVLMACFNSEKYILQSLNSIFSQTLPPDEIIIVDDGSTDITSAIVSQQIDNRIRLIRQDNRGASAARNRAFQSSSGRLVIFVDADDVIAPQHLESLSGQLANASRCVALSKWDRFYKCTTEARFPDRPTERDMPGIDWLLLDWATCRPMTQSGMFLIPRVLIEESGGWNEDLSLIDDFEFFARIISRSDGVRFAPEARLFYRSGISGSLSGQKSRRAVESAFLSLMLGTQHLLDVEDSARTRRVCANVLQDFEYTYYPEHGDLRARIRERVRELGGSDLQPDGPPGFQRLRRLTGWKIARRVQRLAERNGLNSVSRRMPAIVTTPK